MSALTNRHVQSPVLSASQLKPQNGDN